MQASFTQPVVTFAPSERPTLTQVGPFIGQRMILFSYFGDAGGVTEETYAFESSDGVNFTALNDGDAVLSELPSGEAYGLAVVKYQQEYVGVYGIGPRGSQGGGSQFGIARSTDLISWTYRAAISITVTGRPNLWSAHAFVDDTGEFYIFFTAVSADKLSQSIYYIKATNQALTTWTAPTAVVMSGNFGSSVQRDPFVMKVDDKYHMLLGGNSGIRHISSYKITGPWLVEQGGNNGEAAWLVPLPRKSGWRLYFDYSEQGAGNRYCDLSYDLKTGWLNWADATPLTPANYHHACVVLVGDSAIETQDKRWVDPLLPKIPNRSDFVVVDEFLGGTSVTGIGQLCWVFGGVGSLAGVPPTYADPRPGVMRLRTTAGSNAYAAADAGGAYAYNKGTDLEMEITMKVTSITAVTYAVGLMEGTNPTTSGGLMVLVDPASSSNFLIVARGSVTRTIDTGVALDTNWHTFRIRQINSYLAASVADGAGGAFSTEVNTSSLAASYNDNPSSLIAIQTSTEVATKDLLLDRVALSQKLSR